MSEKKIEIVFIKKMAINLIAIAIPIIYVVNFQEDVFSFILGLINLVVFYSLIKSLILEFKATNRTIVITSIFWGIITINISLLFSWFLQGMQDISVIFDTQGIFAYFFLQAYIILILASLIQYILVALFITWQLRKDAKGTQGKK